MTFNIAMTVARLEKPIFIVGSPRSGTSILTWCLGQHANIFVQEESNWIGRLAVQLGVAYELGTARGERSQLSALDVSRADFFALFGEGINQLILDRSGDLERKLRARAKMQSSARASSPEHKGFRITRSPSDPKGRWVDGTPEYSFYICALRKLFPASRFIHIVRDVTAVVRSIMNFHRAGGPRLVETEQQAYEKWLRSVRACRQAELAYGSEIVCRISYASLIAEPEATLRSLLTFLDEAFEAACLEPLQSRINSSEVPADFDSSDSKTDMKVMLAAKNLEAELSGKTRPILPSAEIAEEMEADFRARVQYFSNLESDHARNLRRIASLQKELDKQRK